MQSNILLSLIIECRVRIYQEVSKISEITFRNPSVNLSINSFVVTCLTVNFI